MKVYLKKFITEKAIHAFLDASTLAYGACIYAVTNANGDFLLCAKSRVEPAKEMRKCLHKENMIKM